MRVWCWCIVHHFHRDGMKWIKSSNRVPSLRKWKQIKPGIILVIAHAAICVSLMILCSPPCPTNALLLNHRPHNFSPLNVHFFINVVAIAHQLNHDWFSYVTSNHIIIVLFDGAVCVNRTPAGRKLYPPLRLTYSCSVTTDLIDEY